MMRRLVVVPSGRATGAKPSLGARFRSSSTRFPSWGDIGSRASRFVSQNWFNLALPGMVLLCQHNPRWFCDGGVVGMERFKDASVVGIFLCSGLSIPLMQMRRVAAFWSVHAYMQGFGFLLTPALMYSLLPFFRETLQLPEPICTGFLILSALPASIGVPIALTRVAHGDGAVTLLNSIVSNLIGVVVTPLLVLWMTGLHAEVDAKQIIAKLMLLVAAPSICGIAFRNAVPFLARLDPVWKALQPVLLLGLLANVFSNAFVANKKSTISKEVMTTLLVCGAALNVVLVGLLYFTSGLLRFPPATRAAAIMTMSQKTAAMGVPLINVMFHGDPNLALLTAPLLCYHPVAAVLGGGAASIVRRALRL